MNFCKIYNKIMNRLDKIFDNSAQIYEKENLFDGYRLNRKSVTEISIILGIIYIIITFIATILFSILFRIVVIIIKLNRLTISKCERENENKEK